MLLAIVGQKGGIGKTSTAIAVATEWQLRGRKVLLVDADPQGTVRTWGAVAAESGEATPTIVAMGATLHRPDQLPALVAGYDHVVVDCPPRLGDVQRAALMVANVALLPCGPSAAETWALAESLDLVRQAQILRPDLRAALIITRRQARTAVGAVARTALASTGLPILAAELCQRVTHQEAIAAGKGVTRFAPSSAAATEVRALVDELETMATPARARAKGRKTQ